MCEGLRDALNAHFPTCPQCEEARRSVSGVLDAGNLRVPCADGLALLNDHLDACRVCSAAVRTSLHGLAVLLRAPEGPSN